MTGLPDSLPKSVGTIGAGNMAEAILRGLLRAGLAPERLVASDLDAGRREHIERELGVPTSDSNADVAERAEVVVLAVKPAHLESASTDLPRDDGPLFVSIIAGKTSASLQAHLGAGARIVRAMPNTPALIGEGITAIASDTGVSAQDLKSAEAVLSAVGRVVRVPEALMDAVTGLSGSGPAYAYLFIEALIDAGVREGLPAATARELSTQTVLGAAAMVRETGENPALLRERVSSPGGTTIAGLASLEEGGLREAIFAAVRAATVRSGQLGGDS
ncbi:MAG: pyrroline-5-carboxylate reductase [bacterium]|nr:pyrroline-5-carboxylate reductase [bacterium]